MPKESRKISVLLIEDNIGFRFLFRDALESLGYNVLEAEDGKTGCEIAERDHPNLILLDLMIPQLNGFEVLARLKGDTLTRDIRIVVLSVLSEPKDVEKSMALGADDYIVKGSLEPVEIIRRSCKLFIQQ